VAAFIGDSYTTGTGFGGQDSDGWPATLSRAHGWAPVLEAVGGSGYVAGADRGTNFASRVPAVVQAKPSYVIVSGSRNDRYFQAAEIQASASEVIRTLQGELPNTTIVVVGVLWDASTPLEGTYEANEAVRNAATSAGVPFIDGLTDPWLNDPALIGTDLLHPNNAGHAEIAARVGQALTGLGIAPAPTK